MIEEAEEELKHRMFDPSDLTPYKLGADSTQQLVEGDTTIIGMNRQEVVTRDEKEAALKTNYVDPFTDLLQNL